MAAFFVQAWRHWPKISSAAFAAALMLGAPQASAQALTAAHLQAARGAVGAIHATDQFDSFLPDTALELKNELSQRDPNLAGLISKTVDEEAMKLAARRGDLEKEVARIYARHFSEAELNAITQFYLSPTGKKLLKDGPASMAESVGAYDIWRQGVAQDLGVNVGRALDQKLSAAAAAQSGQSGAGAAQSGLLGAQGKTMPALKFGQ